MREISGYPEPSPDVVRTPRAAMMWTGADGKSRQVPLSSVRVSRSFGTGLPSSVAGVDDMVAADGDASWPLGAQVVSGDLQWAWGRDDLPTPGQSVTVELGVGTPDGEVLVRTLTGRIDARPGTDVRDRTVNVRLVDRIDRLDRPFSSGPLYYRHPSPTPGEWYMDIGLHPAFMTDRIVRRCGFATTPPTWARSFVSATLQGSLWPERGRLMSAGSHPSTTPQPGWRESQPVFTTTPFGMGLRDGQAILTPDVPAGQPWSRTRPLFFHWLFGATVGTGFIRMKAVFQNGAAFTVWQTTNRIDVMAHGTNDSVIATRTFLMPSDSSTRDNEASVWIALDGTLTVQINDNSPGTAVSFSAPTGDSTIVSFSVEAATTAMWVAGVQAGFAGEADLHDWERTSILEVSNQQEQQLANFFSVTESNCLSMLKKQANSELAAMWLDQYGRFRYRSNARLMGAAPSGNLPLRHLHNIKFSSEWGSVREQVHVRYLRPRVSRSVWRNVNAWQASTLTVEPGDMLEEFIHPAADTDWISVGPMKVLDDVSDEKLFNWGRDSWIAGVIESDTEGVEPVSAATYLKAYASMEQVDHRTWLLTVDGSGLASGTRLVLKTADWSGLRESRRGEATPVLRAEVVATRAEETVIGRPFGPANTGMYERDAGEWIQNSDFAQQIADQIASYTGNPQSIAEGVEVAFDDRRELGDVYTVQGATLPDGSVKDVTALCVAIEDRYTSAPAHRTQALTLQALRIGA